MNSATDTALTVAELVISAPFVLFFGIPFGTVTGSVAMDQQQRQPNRLDAFQRTAALVVPPLVLFGAYIAAVVLTSRATGPTFQYPLIAIPLGFAGWYVALVGLTEWVQNTRIAGPFIESHQDALRRKFHTAASDVPLIVDAAQAVAAVAEHIRYTGIDYPTTDLVAERFEAGWSVYAPVQVDTSNAAAFAELPVGRAVFLIGESGRIEQTSSSTPLQEARQRFIVQERALGRGDHPPAAPR
ncbi:hypothetical protein MKUB_49990 [Mycobacterium kubicae]|uniref:Uncharacterized protein n=1 Tax=Mycobacterium kubicae TaxID=120959 RepID=A0AAX1J4W9_9MYCO|nr:hypothetical protein [Mycobacterium kubicae]MCV7094674.1 hypothetical protein [Mycobacterium kubicae]ORV97642.1 hypothetical protein AWC13_15515 [Mycobacterium kubicae]QNI13014.1 hypothetical protein GAN18_19185 [Mycobacterium kubicae]QPI36530.1 hypothetical protein I2456_18875 [Mycobacterium kubicae]GFG67509.1 hypothetical protein MKUB_49990 [Mycobacterium kubicae]